MLADLSDVLARVAWRDHAARAATVVFILLLALLFVRIARRVATRWVTRVTNRALARLSDEDERARAGLRASTLGDVMGDTVAVVIWVAAFFAALGELGVNLAGLIAGAGIAGAAIDFGAQSLVRDFLSGFFILLEDQYGIGDRITANVEGVEGVVEDVSLRITRLRADDGQIWFIGNGQILQLGNRSKGPLHHPPGTADDPEVV